MEVFSLHSCNVSKNKDQVQNIPMRDELTHTSRINKLKLCTQEWTSHTETKESISKTRTQRLSLELSFQLLDKCMHRHTYSSCFVSACWPHETVKKDPWDTEWDFPEHLEWRKSLSYIEVKGGWGVGLRIASIFSVFYIFNFCYVLCGTQNIMPSHLKSK